MRSLNHSVSRLTTALLSTTAVLASAVSMSPPASADEYKTEGVSECCNGETIEAGATEREHFLMRNLGTVIWGSPESRPINLGTIGTNELEASSPFRASSWASPNRPESGVAYEVPTGGTYDFAFDVTAPEVTERLVYHQHFGLLAEGSIPEKGRWMLPYNQAGPNLELTFNVVPQQPPTIKLSVSASTIAKGEALSVDTIATDIASVNRVVISFAGQEWASVVPRNPTTAPDERTTWSPSTSFVTNNTGTGPQSVTATVYSDAGLSATATATVQVTSSGGGVSGGGGGGGGTGEVVVNGVHTRVLPGGFHPSGGGKTVPGHGNELRLRHLVISGTTKGESVSVLCRHCQGTRKLGPVRARGHEVIFQPRQMIVTSRSELVLYVTEPGFYGRYTAFKVNLNGTPLKAGAQGCLQEGGVKQIRCP